MICVLLYSLLQQIRLLQQIICCGSPAVLWLSQCMYGDNLICVTKICGRVNWVGNCVSYWLMFRFSGLCRFLFAWCIISMVYNPIKLQQVCQDLLWLCDLGSQSSLARLSDTATCVGVYICIVCLCVCVCVCMYTFDHNDMFYHYACSGDEAKISCH